MRPSVGVAVITHNARTHLLSCLSPLLDSPLKPHILVVNSSSEDGTVELAKQLGVKTLLIPKAPFNHGLVRELARKALNTDIVVMVTPDAYALNKDVLQKLIQPLIKGEAACAYARQLPRPGAKIWEAFPRNFNYPPMSQLRSIENISQYGVYNFFFSNSFGAYLNKALDEIGGFSPVLTGEDTVACAQLLLKGYKVAYVAEAEVYHSHNFSLKKEFHRHFDIGLSRKERAELFALCGKEKERGLQYFFALLQFLHAQKKYHYIPYALLHIWVKWSGFTLGQHSHQLPLWLKKQLSDNRNYW